MSCIQLSTQHIAAVAHGLAFILNGAGGMCHLAASHELPELYDALSICRYPHDFLVDDRKVYAVLYRLNEAAYEGRYNVEPGSADEFPTIRLSSRTCSIFSTGMQGAIQSTAIFTHSQSCWTVSSTSATKMQPGTTPF